MSHPRRSRELFLRLIVTAAAALTMVASVRTRQAASPPVDRVDAIFAKWTATTPGCAVGVRRGGAHLLEKGYGMADLEHEVPNRGETIFEAGSVSKQFTAAAVLLLAQEGKLSLDDAVRKHIPELPEYAAAVTIRQMLNHTAGLRDWGSLFAIGGWPRTTRVYTHAHVLDILTRQRALNFPAGTRYSYSNSGYSLSAILVARTSGQPFAEFTGSRLFEPLGMTRTSWRDDFARVVKDRAIAYASRGAEFRQEMPFENTHGHGGLLTTVGDLLRWTANFDQPKVGDAAFLRQMQEPGRFNDGRQHNYALGLTIDRYKGQHEVGHSGATAGYRAHLASYPERAISVAVLCNAAAATATPYARATADLYLNLPDATPPPPPASAGAVAAAQLDALVGTYASEDSFEPTRVARDGNGLRVGNSGALRPDGQARFAAANGRVYEFADDRMRITDAFGSVQSFARIGDDRLEPGALDAYPGTYRSDEADVAMVAAVDGDSLTLGRRAETPIRLTPAYADVFDAGALGHVRFDRDGSGAVTGLTVSQDRVWSLRFVRE